jgi:hypothetical protein
MKQISEVEEKLFTSSLNTVYLHKPALRVWAGGVTPPPSPPPYFPAGISDFDKIS